MDKIREFFWPLLEKSVQLKIKETIVQDIKIESQNIKKALDFSIKIYDAELTRNSSIETKASLLISTLSITTTIILALTTILVKKQIFDFINIMSFVFLFLLIVYFLRTVWFAIKALERKPFHTFYYNDINLEGNEDDYNKELLVKIINKIERNSSVINSKVDNMVMAQEYFKRAIVTLFIYAFSLIIYLLISL